MKAAIIYYSLEGNTELIARLFAKYTKSDLIPLHPKKEIKKGFMKYFWGGKSVVFNEKPELVNPPIPLDNYDTVFIGTPIWASTFAPPIHTFLTQYKIENKNIILFACHAGGGADKCFDKFKKNLNGNVILGTIDFKEPNKADVNEVQKRVEDFIKNYQ